MVKKERSFYYKSDKNKKFLKALAKFSFTAQNIYTRLVFNKNKVLY